MVHAGEHAVVDYRLTLDNGMEYANTKATGEPVDFVMGSGTMLPDFELAVAGMEIGETRGIHIPANHAYGQRDENLVISVAPVSLPNGDSLVEGSIVGLSTPNGVMRVKVVSVGDDEVVIDCNHELAGTSLDFEITLLKVYGESAIEHELHSEGCTCGCERLQASLAS